MRIDYGLVVLEICAIFASYIVLFMPLSFAANINIYSGSYSENTVLDLDDEVQRSVTTNEGTDSVTISMKNASLKQVSRVLIYKCVDANPADCIASVSPDEFIGNVLEAYEWSEIADTSSAYPETAFIIVLVELSAGTNSWHGFRYKLRKTQYGFDPVYSWSINNIEVRAQTSSMVTKIREFIDLHGMIPFNPGWTLNVSLNSADGFDEAYADEPPTGFITDSKTGTDLLSLPNDYLLAFPKIGNEYHDSVSFIINPTYTCGDGTCNDGTGAPDLGETAGNCCYDCGCFGGQYCDSDLGCRSESVIGLELLGRPQTGINNCYESHNINVYAKIKGAPTGMNVGGYSYKLGDQDAQPMSCNKQGEVYNCPITIPEDPECSGSNYELGPNSVSFDISYPDGTATKTKTINTSFPDVVIGSWTCGQSGCQSDIGEDDSKCCYDCPCTGTNEYCDFDGNFVNTQCRQDLSNKDLNVIDVDSAYFYTHQAGDRIGFIAEITNKPSGLLSAIPDCSVRCISEDSSDCASGCGISCTQLYSNDAEKYNASCNLTFTINDYNPINKYWLYPKLFYGLGYNNGSQVIEKTLNNSEDMPEITVDKHWCGDGVCNPDENNGNCCYDCACLGDQYCDTNDTSQFTAGDMCKPLDEITIAIGPPDNTVFEDYLYAYDMHIDAVASNIPTGSVLEAACSLANGDVVCEVECSEIDDASGQSVCTLVVPSINYKTSSYYDSASRTIILPENSLNLSLAFNNGSSTTCKQFSFDIPDVSIGVTYHCRDGYCEGNLDEDELTCCVDCGCFDENEYCYTGIHLAGQCLHADQLKLLLKNTYPSDFGCTIMELRGDCVFTTTLGVNVGIPNKPDDTRVVSTWFGVDNRSKHTRCLEDPDNPSNYSCALLLDNLEESTQGMTELNVSLSFSIAYTTNRTQKVQNITNQFTVNITRTESDYVKTCKQQIDELDDEIKDLEKDKRIVKVILYSMLGITAVFCACCIIPYCKPLCDYCEPGICITSTVALALIPMLSEIDNNVNNVKSQRSVMCPSSSYDDLAASTSDAHDTGMNTGTIVAMVAAVIVAAYCLFKALGQGSNNAPVQDTASNAGSKMPHPTPADGGGKATL